MKLILESWRNYIAEDDQQEYDDLRYSVLGQVEDDLEEVGMDWILDDGVRDDIQDLAFKNNNLSDLIKSIKVYFSNEEAQASKWGYKDLQDKVLNELPPEVQSNLQPLGEVGLGTGLDDAEAKAQQGESDRVEMEETNIAQQSQKDMAQARKDVSFGTSPEEKEEVSKLTSMIIAFSKKKDLTKGRVAKLIDLLKQEMIKQAKLSAEPEEPMEEEKIKNPGKYMGGDRQQAGVDDDGDGVPNKADKSPKDGSKK